MERKFLKYFVLGERNRIFQKFQVTEPAG